MNTIEVTILECEPETVPVSVFCQKNNTYVFFSYAQKRRKSSQHVHKGTEDIINTMSRIENMIFNNLVIYSLSEF